VANHPITDLLFDRDAIRCSRRLTQQEAANCAAYAFSEVQDLSPHSHWNMWKRRPTLGSSMLVRKRGCFPHFRQSGDVGFCGAGLSMANAECRADPY
jgi:hypothetical protein